MTDRTPGWASASARTRPAADHQHAVLIFKATAMLSAVAKPGVCRRLPPTAPANARPGGWNLCERLDAAWLPEEWRPGCLHVLLMQEP
jgi:hypothetical protein